MNNFYNNPLGASLPPPPLVVANELSFDDWQFFVIQS